MHVVASTVVACGGLASGAAVQASEPGDERAAELPESADWERLVPGGDCQCADGAEFSFFVHDAAEAAAHDADREETGGETRVLLYFEGGGACWDSVGCAFTREPSTTYDWDIGPDDHPMTRGGIVDLDDDRNPFAGYSIVYVPYCTGDVFLGDTVTEYSDDVTVAHKGAVNRDAAIEHLVATFPDAAQVVVAGESAGSIPSPLVGAMVAEQLPDAQVTVIGDGSGGYPDVPGINGLLATTWGTMNAVPDWPATAGLGAEDWSIPGLWIVGGTHAPDVVMARVDFAYDAVQVGFAALAGIDAEGLLDFMDENEAAIEAAGVNQYSFTAPGDDHTVLTKPEFYDVEVGGVALVDWVAELIAGEDVGDVRCTECG